VSKITLPKYSREREGTKSDDDTSIFANGAEIIAALDRDGSQLVLN